jgi:prepilin-type N-terminal cleavage/methylation domain-containing protein
VSYNRPGREQSRRQSLRPRGGRRPAAGFTLVEILTAIAIIAILVTMAVLAFKHTGGVTKTNTTKTMLQNVRGMYAEFEGQGGRTKDFLQWYTDTSTTPPTPKPAVMPPPTQPYIGDYAELYKYLPGPNGPLPKYGDPTYDLWVTAYKVMPKLRSVPANKSVFDSIPADHIYPPGWVATKSYQDGERVQSANGFFVCTAAYSAGGSTAAKPPEQDAGHWKADDPNLMILDAWGSPIIFVPPMGAANLTEGSVTWAAANPKRAPDQKGYFMSAGEDRNMSLGDDNVYSFENK